MHHPHPFERSQKRTCARHIRFTQLSSTKIPETIEWSSCNETEVAGILRRYKDLDSAPDALRPRCLDFFEASDVGRIGFVFADRDFKAQGSLRRSPPI